MTDRPSQDSPIPAPLPLPLTAENGAGGAGAAPPGGWATDDGISGNAPQGSAQTSTGSPQETAGTVPSATAAHGADRSRRSFAAQAGIVGSMTMLSRILGLVREQVFAALFGAGLEADAFNVASRIPNLLRALFAEGALSSAFVPTFSAAVATEGRERAYRLVDRVTGTLMLAVVAVVVAMIVMAGPLVALVAPGFAAVPGKLALTVTLTRIIAPFLGLIAIAAVWMGTLNSLDHFALPAFAPTMLNLGMIVVGTALALAIRAAGGHAVVGMAIGVLVGGLGQLLIQLPPLVKEGYRPRPAIDMRDPGVQHILALMAPATVGLAATQINILVSTWIASMLVQGSVSWLTYAFRLMQLPIGVLGVSVATVAIPSISRAIAVKDLARARDEVSRGLQLTLAMTVPASVALLVLARPIIALIYQHGRFTAFDTEQTALALAWYSVGLVGFSAVKLLVPVWYALNETSLPVRASMVAVAINVVLNIALMHSWGHQGLAMATSVTGLANAAFVLWPLRTRLSGIGGRRMLDQSLRIVVASGLMGVALWYVHGLTVPLGTRFIQRLIGVGVTSLSGIVVLIIAMELLAVDEGRHAIRLVTTRLRRVANWA